MDRRVSQRFGSNLCHSRRRADLSQMQLAELAQIHRTEVSLLERGLRMPRLDTILKVAAAADASPCGLLAGLRWQAGHDAEGEFRIDDAPKRSTEARRPLA